MRYLLLISVLFAASLQAEEEVALVIVLNGTITAASTV